MYIYVATFLYIERNSFYTYVAYVLLHTWGTYVADVKLIPFKIGGNGCQNIGSHRNFTLLLKTNKEGRRVKFTNTVS